MGVYLSNMEMPTGCGVCPFADDECFGAWKCWRVKDWGDDDNRAKGCPLISVPPHYDLIDHNALKIAVMNGDCETRVDFLKHTIDCINKAPVVIPSDMPTYEGEEEL